DYYCSSHGGSNTLF
nr:immunoglobulin light chain junction region [Macaca mulatta]MOX12245.1 immunoglobulin light chain junction region [Macaca mulatta]MOX12261.1 immunoglobulin light chain junction region [Macaca mulatta]MOX13595.1 immunoglobulin light chain junction region [Macaca mulatta]